MVGSGGAWGGGAAGFGVMRLVPTSSLYTPGMTQASQH